MRNKLLKQFLIKSNIAGYASGEEKKWKNESDGSTSINYVDGIWRFHDNFFGGEPYGGRLVVFKNNNPYWIMVYYGWVDKKANTDEVYKVLRIALKNMPEAAPFRGPKEIKQNNYTYRNSWTGDIERYTGEEQITQNGKLCYKANYMGGLVNIREGV